MDLFFICLAAGRGGGIVLAAVRVSFTWFFSNETVATFDRAVARGFRLFVEVVNVILAGCILIFGYWFFFERK